MKRLTLVAFFLSLVLTSCQKYGEVRIMPEFNHDKTEIELFKNEGSSVTVTIHTDAKNITAEYTADWLSVDANPYRVIYKAVQANETGEKRSTVVKLLADNYTKEVTVTQIDKDADEVRVLKVGDLTEDGQGMIFWVDPNDPEVGKAISLKRFGGNPFEAAIKLHSAFSTVNGMENTLLYTDAGENDAAALAQSFGEGWYLPASGELKEFFKAYNGAGPDDANFTNAVPGSISDAEKAARKKFEDMMAALGGDVINDAGDTGNGNSYWSSTEDNTGEKAYYVRFGKWALATAAKTGTARHVRGMCGVGKFKFPEEPATIAVAPGAVNLTYEANATVEVIVTTNKDTYEFIYDDEAAKSWLEITKVDEKLTFKALSENNTELERATTVTLKAGSGDAERSIQLNVTQEVKPATSAYTIGQYVDEDKGVKLAEGGIVVWIDPLDGNNAKILSLKREKLAWGTDKTEGATTAIGCSDEDDGEVNTNKMKECAFAANLPCLKNCVDGWYIPARNELNDLYELYNGGPGVKSADPTEAELAARAVFNKYLSDAGTLAGVDVEPMDTKGGSGDSYFSSTENPNDGSEALYVRFGTYTRDYGAKKSAARHIRCIRKVSFQ